MYTTDAIVLKRTDAGEADSFVTLYTKEFGKIRALAQGVKKEGAKLKGHCEPLQLSSMSFVIGKGGMRLTHALLIYDWQEFRSSLEKAQCAFFVAQQFDSRCEEGERDRELWDFLLAQLQGLAAGDATMPREKIHAACEGFMKGLSEQLGYGENSIEGSPHFVISGL